MRNQRGFSLVELVVTLGISGIFTLMWMRYSLNSYNQDAHLRYLAEINSTLTTLQYALSKPEMCTKVFKDKTTVPDLNDYLTGVELTDITNGREWIRVGEHPYFNVDKIQIYNSPISNSGFDLEIRFSPRTTSVFNSFFSGASKEIVKRYTIVGARNGNTIISCGPIVSDINLKAKEEFCNSMTNLATWDTTVTPPTCRFKHTSFTCPAGRVPKDIHKTTGLVCEHIANRVDLDELFDTSSVKNCPSKNYTLYQLPNGKITIGCPDATEAGVDVPLP